MNEIETMTDELAVLFLILKWLDQTEDQVVDGGFEVIEQDLARFENMC